MPGLDERFFGKYRARVADNKDPEKRGRLKLLIPAIWSMQVTEFADPVFGISGIEQGFLGVPEIGAAVWAEFEAGDPLCPIWSGGWYADVPVGSVNDPGVASEARQTDPTKLVLKWGSNLVEIDRKVGSEFIRITSKSGAIFEMDPAGKVRIEAEDIEIGKVGGGFPSFRKLIDERIIALDNAHTHLDSMGAPTTSMGVSIPPTVLTTGEAPQGVSTSRTKGN